MMKISVFGAGMVGIQMARTTGYTGTIIARQPLNGMFFSRKRI